MSHELCGRWRWELFHSIKTMCPNFRKYPKICAVWTVKFNGTACTLQFDYQDYSLQRLFIQKLFYKTIHQESLKGHHIQQIISQTFLKFLRCPNFLKFNSTFSDTILRGDRTDIGYRRYLMERILGWSHALVSVIWQVDVEPDATEKFVRWKVHRARGRLRLS